MTTTTISRDVLADALSRAAVTAGDARRFPILGAVLLHGSRITTTNLEAFTTVDLDGVLDPDVVFRDRRIFDDLEPGSR